MRDKTPGNPEPNSGTQKVTRRSVVAGTAVGISMAVAGFLGRGASTPDATGNAGSNLEFGKEYTKNGQVLFVQPTEAPLPAGTTISTEPGGSTTLEESVQPETKVYIGTGDQVTFRVGDKQANGFPLTLDMRVRVEVELRGETITRKVSL